VGGFFLGFGRMDMFVSVFVYVFVREMFRCVLDMMVIFFVQYEGRSVPAKIEDEASGREDDAEDDAEDDGDGDARSEAETDAVRARPKVFARAICEKSEDRGGDEPEEEDGARARLERATRGGGGVSRIDVRGRIGDRQADGGGHDARRRRRAGGVARGRVVRGLELTVGFRRLATKIADDGTESGDDANLYLVVERGLPGVFRCVRDL